MSLVLRSQRAFSESNGNLPPQYANVRSCNCCPYGYHIDLDFVRYCEALANAKPSEEEIQRRDRRRSRKSMEFMLGLDSIFDQWDNIDRQQTLTEVPNENEIESTQLPYRLQRTPSFTYTTQYNSQQQHQQQQCPQQMHYSSYQTTNVRPRSSSVPRFTSSSQYPRSESPFGTASSTCSSYRGAESDAAPYPMRHPPVSPPERKAFLHDALDEVCNDFERTLERASMKRRKGGGAAGRLALDEGDGVRAGYNGYHDRNNNNSHNYSKNLGANYLEKRPNGLHGQWSWDSPYDSCVAGNKSPRNSRFYTKPLPYQQKLSPAELQYESYVKATVAANAKSPVEDVMLTTTTTTDGAALSTAAAEPPPPPPRKHLLTAKLSLSSPIKTTLASAPAISTTECLPSTEVSGFTKESSPSTASTTAAPADAQTLFNIRQQMALSLKRMKDLEEQVKSIPELQDELTQLREEKDRLQQTVQKKDEELQKAKEATRFSSSPSPVSSTKATHFQPQRVSPVSLESLGSRLRTSSTSSDKALSSKSCTPPLKRDVGTMCSKHTTRDIAVGSPLPRERFSRDIGCNASLSANIHETIYTKKELEQRIQVSLVKHEEQLKLQRLKDLITVGTQMYVAKKELRDSGAQTKPNKPVQKYSVATMAQPTMRESYVSCKPDVRTVGCSNDRISDVLCDKCEMPKRTVACSTEEPYQEDSAKSLSLKLLDMPARSNTFSLGDNEKLNIKRKTIGTQYTPAVVHSTGCQTAMLLVHTQATQFAPEVQCASTQSQVESASRQTDTKDLMHLCTTQTSTEEIAAPRPATIPEEQEPKPTAKALQYSTKACNTEPKKFKENGSNTQRAAEIRHSSSNTEQIHKRDIACGDTIKPHISIACADNYCDSCKDAIKNLAKDFSKVLQTPQSPQPRRAAESKIPRPKNLPSPSPVRRQFQRQNTYTLSPSPTEERKSGPSSLQEKSTSSNSLFHQLETTGESQSFIIEPKASGHKPMHEDDISLEEPEAEAEASLLESPESKSPQRTSRYDLSKLGEDELIVREETRVSISWSRDNSPAPAANNTTASGQTQQDIAAIEKQKQPEEEKPTTSAEARKKLQHSNIPLKSSQIRKEPVHEAEEKHTQQQQQQEAMKAPPSKALLQKIAMKETEPRKKMALSKELLTALNTVNGSLQKKLNSKSLSSFSLKPHIQLIHQIWFKISSSEQADPHELEDFLDCLEEKSVPLLEYCVNAVDGNGNTAMHYAVSHCNFDIVSILLDSKVCNVNQMNNAGYTCVMLVSLAKLKSPEHRLVVERLFQMADVNVRAKKHCQTALMLAVSHGNLEMVQLLLAAGADINIQDEDGSTALMCAAEHGRSDIVKHLLTHPDCDSLIQDADGSTAFKISWQAGHRDIGVFLYVHEQMLRSKNPNQTEPVTMKKLPASPSSLPKFTHKRQPSK